MLIDQRGIISPLPQTGILPPAQGAGYTGLVLVTRTQSLDTIIGDKEKGCFVAARPAPPSPWQDQYSIPWFMQVISNALNDFWLNTTTTYYNTPLTATVPKPYRLLITLYNDDIDSHDVKVIFQAPSWETANVELNIPPRSTRDTLFTLDRDTGILGANILVFQKLTTGWSSGTNCKCPLRTFFQ